MKKTNMRKIIALVFTVVLILGFVTPVNAETECKKVTVMLYICGADLQTSIYNTLGSIRNSRYNTNDVNVIGLLGGSTTWPGFSYNPKALSLLNIDSSRIPPIIQEYDYASMGDPATLSMFLNVCYEQYPADHYVLILKDHGGGPNAGVCFDSRDNHNSLSTVELETALENSPFSEKKLDLIAFDACLMGSAEVATRVAPYAEYMVASEDSMYGGCFSFSWLNSVEKDESIYDTAIRIVDETFAANGETIERLKSNLLNAFSVTDLSKMENLNQAMNAFFSKVTADLNVGNYTAMSASVRNTTAFGVGESGPDEDYDLVDLGDLVTNLSGQAPEEASQVLAALGEAVPYHQPHDPENTNGCTGLTVYHPFNNKRAVENRMKIYNELGFSEKYTGYVQHFASILTGKPLAAFTGMKTASADAKDMRTLFCLDLTEEQAAHLGAEEFIVLHKDSGKDAYRFVFVSNDVNLKVNSLSSSYLGTALYAVDADGNSISDPILYYLDGDTYYIPALLHMDAGEDLDEDGELVTAWDERDEKVLIACTLDFSTKTLSPSSVQIYDKSLGGYTTIHNTSFTDYQRIQLPMVWRSEKRDDNGTLLPFEQWDVVEETMWPNVIDSSWRFKLLNDTISETSLYAMFEVTDCQNNVYISDPLVISGSSDDRAMKVHYDDDLLLLDQVSLTAYDEGDTIYISATITNRQEQEVYYELNGFLANDIATEGKGEAFGSGSHYGLVQDEEALLHGQLDVSSLKNVDIISKLKFDIVIFNAASDEEIGSVEVNIDWMHDMNAEKE